MQSQITLTSDDLYCPMSDAEKSHALRDLYLDYAAGNMSYDNYKRLYNAITGTSRY